MRSQRGIRVLQPSGIRTPEFFSEMAALAPDCIVVVAYGKILPPSLLALPPLGCVNVHASLLPQYRGAAPIQWALINGEKKTGVTTMLLDAGMDTGDMLLKEEVEIYDDDDASTLSHRLSRVGASLLMKTLRGLTAGTVIPVSAKRQCDICPSFKEGRRAYTMGSACP